jgi:hypothetical protein
VPPLTAPCRLLRPDREIHGITALETDSDTGMADDDAASPELALIDSTLRERLARAMSAPPAEHDSLVLAEAPSQVRRHPVRFAVFIVAALLVAGGIASYRLVRPGPSATTPATSAPRVFAWAPAAGALAYAFEIRRDGVVIYAARTTRTRVQVPIRWARRGTTFTLSRGAYRWYVWPVSHDSRLHEPAALVAASFRVDG